MNTDTNQHSAIALLLTCGLLSFNTLCATVSEAGTKNPLCPGAVTTGLIYPVELREGYLKVYSATDRFEDGGVPYYPHSSYSIYTADGKFFERIENHISFNDEVPELVALPVGSYTIDVRSEKDGYVRVRVRIEANRRTVLNLDEA